MFNFNNIILIYIPMNPLSFTVSIIVLEMVTIPSPAKEDEEPRILSFVLSTP